MIDLQFFGGRGASSAGGAGGAASGELELPDGSKIEFDGDLHYDGDDAALSGAARQAITGWEDKRAKAKIEYGYAVDVDGNPIGPEVRGGKGSVRVPYAYHMTPNSVFTHIHPRGDGQLGGTFSGADMRNFARFGNMTCRARAKEGTYSISKGKNFDQQGFLSFVSSNESKCRKSYGDRQGTLNKQYKNGKISYDDYKFASAKSFNTFLVDLHEGFRSGQKKYGYTYTLERSK